MKKGDASRTALSWRNLYNNTRTVRNQTLSWPGETGPLLPFCSVLRVYFLLAITPYIEGIRLERKAGLLTLFHISGTFPPLGSGVVARVHNGTHSCGTVEDLHLVPFLIASIANLCAAKLRIFYELTKKSHLFYQKICVIRQNCLILQRK